MGAKASKKNKYAQSAAGAQGDAAEEKAPQASGGNVAEKDVATTLAEPPQRTAGDANKTASNMPETNDAFAIGARRVFVQFRDDIPFAVTYFGALLYTTSDGHVLVDIDGSGLAWQVGCQENDVILSVNNTESPMVNCPQRAILDTLADVGTKISLVVKRQCQHGTFFLYFAFHVGERDGSPAVVNVYSYCIGNEEVLESLFPILTRVLPPDFPHIPFVPLYKFDSQTRSQIINVSDGRFMQIRDTLADFVTPRVILNMVTYERVHPIHGAPTPIAISDMVSSTSRSCGCPDEHEGVNHTDDDDRDPPNSVCVSGIRRGPLNVVDLPPYMTGPNPIAGNSKFFFISANPDGTYCIKNRNNTTAFSMGQSSDGSYTAVLTREATPLNVVTN